MIKHREQPHHFIPHSRPTLGTEEIKAVSEVIASGHIAEGAIVKEFEQNFADYLNVKHAVATNSGTSALHLALLALEVGPGDEVIIPSYVCCALLNAVNYSGATAAPKRSSSLIFSVWQPIWTRYWRLTCLS